jgi:hypothetical protein
MLGAVFIAAAALVPVINMRNRYASAILCKINELSEQPRGKHVSSTGSNAFLSTREHGRRMSAAFYFCANAPR